MLILAGGVLSTASAQAGDLKKLDISLKWIPDDAAYYSVMLRNQEQIEILRNSKAFAKLIDMPVVQEALRRFDEAAEDPETPAGKFKDGMNNPVVQDVLGLLGDMFSRDVFVYGDKSVVDVLTLMQKLNNAQRSTQVFGQLTKSADVNQQELQARVIIHLLASNPELLRVPEVIAGFKVKNTERVKENLDNLIGIVTLASMSVPELQDCCKRKTVGASEYVTITVKGEQIPWDQVPLDKLREAEMMPGEVDKVVERIKQLTLVIALGLRDDYLLVSVGESTEQLARLGASKLLVDRPEFKPLEKFADRRLTSISYMSKALTERLNTSKEDLDEVIKAVRAIVNETKLTSAQKSQILTDTRALVADLKPLIPQPGAIMAFSFLTDNGLESYSYNWSKGKGIEGGKPLSILEHLGGSPLMACAARNAITPEDYALVTKWLQVGYRYVEQYGVPQMEAKDREEYQKVSAAFGPLVKRVDEVNRTKLLPALVGGEAGMTLEAKLKLKQVAKTAPAFDKPMPMPELAAVLGISNQSQFREALEEYRKIANDAIAKLHELKPNDVPEYKIPAPETTTVKAGTLYTYPLPAEIGIDKRLAPSIGLSDRVAVFSCSREQAERLLTAAPLKVGGALADPGKPRAAAFVLQWATLLDTATPWIELAADQAIKEKSLEAEKDEEIRQQVRTALDLLKVLRTVTAETYVEKEAVVGHHIAVIRDVK
jgi:hypothetical protein